jgi:hypothetical protein
MNVSQKALFLSAYVPALEAAYGSDPEWRRIVLLRNPSIEAMAEKMVEGLYTGAANKDGDAIKAACRALGIKQTYKAIRTFLGGSVQS